MTSSAEQGLRRDSIEFVAQVLALGDGFNEHGDLWDAIWWRTDSEYSPVTFFVNCGDLFYWATADSEDLTPENLPVLLKAVEDVRGALGVPSKLMALSADATQFHDWYASGRCAAELFCCRVRHMRPAEHIMKEMDVRLRPLFEACGPHRPQEETNE
jgi:hypothetical protein